MSPNKSYAHEGRAALNYVPARSSLIAVVRQKAPRIVFGSCPKSGIAQCDFDAR